MPPITLSNPRHEAFAMALARGHYPSVAYRLAGFSDNNAKARSAELLQNPDILARTEHLRACLPQIESTTNRFAPSLLLMPETKEEMTAWLWQVMSGTRTIVPHQLRAATLFCRLKGWHLRTLLPNQTEPAASPTDLTDHERHLLAHHSQHVIACDSQMLPPTPETTAAYLSTMADLALLAADQFPDTRPIPYITQLHQAEAEAETPTTTGSLPGSSHNSHQSHSSHPSHSPDLAASTGKMGKMGTKSHPARIPGIANHRRNRARPRPPGPTSGPTLPSVSLRRRPAARPSFTGGRAWRRRGVGAARQIPVSPRHYRAY